MRILKIKPFNNIDNEIFDQNWKLTYIQDHSIGNVRILNMSSNPKNCFSGAEV